MRDEYGFCIYRDGRCTCPLAREGPPRESHGRELRILCEDRSDELWFMTKGPTFAEKCIRYARAVIAWGCSGLERRSQAEIDRIKAICERCPKFVRDSTAGGFCGLCGCTCGSQRPAWRDKWFMASEACPDTPSRWGPSAGRSRILDLVTRLISG